MAEKSASRFDENCYLCPGNKRANGAQNPSYQQTFVFENDFPALLQETFDISDIDDCNGLIKTQAVFGECRVICFSPHHNLTLPELEINDILAVVSVWQEQYLALAAQYAWVQIIENKGAIMGCSNPHPHGQVWASSFIPSEPQCVNDSLLDYWKQYHSNMLVDYADFELTCGDRVVEQNEDWLVLVPYWAMWPFQTLLLPKRHIRHMGELTTAEKDSLAQILKSFLTRYDNLFGVSFPYSMGWHQAPGMSDDSKNIDHWQLHAHFYPPLLRSSTIRKFMVGYEMLGEPQRDITPELAAEMLRGADNIYSQEL